MSATSASDHATPKSTPRTGVIRPRNDGSDPSRAPDEAVTP
jgi:hypothetical protein